MENEKKTGDGMKVEIPSEKTAAESENLVETVENSVEEPVGQAAEKPQEDDMVTRAMRENEELRKQLEDLKNSQTNVFEQNEALKAELANQEKLMKIAEENAALQAQLDGIKRKSLIESLVARGSLNNDLRTWAEALPFDSLQEFAKHAPKVKTILQEKNGDVSEADKDMEEWKKSQQRSRII